MKNTFRMVVGAATALALSMGTMQANAQVYFSDDFNTGGTAGAVSRGWEFVLNEFVTETGVDFIVTPEWPEGQDGPGTSTGFINPPTANGTESTGGYLMSDSDAAGGSDNIGSLAEVWAISPIFSTAGASQVWFHASAEIESNNNGEALGLVQGTADGGTTWVPIWTLVEPQRVQKETPEIGTVDKFGPWPELGSGSETRTFSGVHGGWHLQLPAELVNQPEVRLRFGWYESADAWWFALDDIVVDGNGPPLGTTEVLTEDFENGIPATWSNTSLNGAIDTALLNGDGYQTWDTQTLRDPAFPDDPLKLHQNLGPVDADIVKMAEIFGLELDLSAPDADVNPNGALDGRWILSLAGRNYAIWQDNFGIPAADSYASNLDTPSLDFSNASGVFIDFLSEVLIGDGSANHSVQVSVDGGTTFSEIFHYQKALMNYGETGYFLHHYLAVPQAAGQSNVIFRFHAEGQDPEQMEGFWVIDDVRVTANTGGGTGVGEWVLY